MTANSHQPGVARRLPVVVLISGNGSNLQALIDHFAQHPHGEIVAVISNREGVFGLNRAEKAGIEAITLSHKDFASREEYDVALQAQIDQYSPALVVLAGFMRILTPGFVNHYHGRLLNIHPSLLPAYRGLNTHQRAIDAGESEHGVSVHFVTEELDGGPVVLQAKVPIKSDDDAKSLASRVQVKEHKIYPLVVEWFVEGRLKLGAEGPVLDDRLLETSLIYTVMD